MQFEKFDVESFRLNTAPTKVRRPGQRQKFLRGPIPWQWLAIAARLPGKALAVALAIWFLAGFKDTAIVSLSMVPLRTLGVSRSAVYRNLTALEEAGLIRAERQRGRKTRIVILELQEQPHAVLNAVASTTGIL